MATLCLIVEAKAGQSASSDMFMGVRRVKGVLESLGEVAALVVYGGQTVQARGDVTLLSRQAIEKQRWS